MHNIMEGVVVSLPLYSATRSVKLVLILTFLNGLCEPLGVLFAYGMSYFFRVDLKERIPEMLSIVGGIMIAISIVELLPDAVKANQWNALFHILGGVLCTAFLLIISNFAGA